MNRIIMYTYEEAKKHVFARGTHKTFGRKEAVEFALLNKVICIVVPSGFFNSGLGDVTGIEEALWIIGNHPSARTLDVNEVIKYEL